MRDWIRLEPERPAPYRTAARIYEDMGSVSQAHDAAQRWTERAPSDATAWERLGRLRLRRFDRRGAVMALARARRIAPSEEGLLDLALAANLVGDVGTEVSACEQATQLAADSPLAPGRGWRTRWPGRIAPPSASPPASARSPWATTPRSATCARWCSPRRRASSHAPPSSRAPRAGRGRRPTARRRAR